jgi:PAS domain S-box-containing protein
MTLKQAVNPAHTPPAAPTGTSSPASALMVDDLRNLLECANLSAAFLDSRLRVRHLSAGLQADPGQGESSCPLDELALHLGYPELPRDAQAVLDTGLGIELTVRPADCRRDHVARLRPTRDDAGRIYGLLLVLLDAAEPRRDESASRRLAAIVESSDDAILSKDLNGIIASWNRGAERLFGYTADEVIGRSVTLLIPDDHPDEEPNILARIRRGETIDHYETVRRRKDGSLVDISLTVSPVIDDDGVIVGASKIARDITYQQRSARQRTVLLHELNHRVKNSLATVQSIASQTLVGAASLDVFGEVFNARLLALSKTHDLLTRHSWQQASLRDLVLSELEPYRSQAASFAIDSNDIMLRPRMVLAFGLMFHELATNAAKYGALSVPDGHVDVSWTVHSRGGTPYLRVGWTESGGPPVVAPTRRGMGTRLLDDAVAGGLDGHAMLEFAPEGIRYTIDVPLESPDDA